jgi:hypothetical protein
MNIAALSSESSKQVPINQYQLFFRPWTWANVLGDEGNILLLIAPLLLSESVRPFSLPLCWNCSNGDH